MSIFLYFLYARYTNIESRCSFKMLENIQKEEKCVAIVPSLKSSTRLALYSCLPILMTFLGSFVAHRILGYNSKHIIQSLLKNYTVFVEKLIGKHIIRTMRRACT